MPPSPRHPVLETLATHGPLTLRGIVNWSGCGYQTVANTLCFYARQTGEDRVVQLATTVRTKGRPAHLWQFVAEGQA